MLVSPADSGNSALSTLPVLHGTSDPTRDTLTAAGLVTNPQVAQAVVKELGLHISAGDLLSKVTATPIGQSNLLALQATSDSAVGSQAAGQRLRRSGRRHPCRQPPRGSGHGHSRHSGADSGGEPGRARRQQRPDRPAGPAPAAQVEPGPDDHGLGTGRPAARPLHAQDQAGTRRRAHRRARAGHRRRLPAGRAGPAAAPRGAAPPPLQRAHPHRDSSRAPAPAVRGPAVADRAVVRRSRGLSLAAHLPGGAGRQQAAGRPAHRLRAG